MVGAAHTADDPARRMDRMYRFTRHVYDASRRYYLLGRDRLLDAIEAGPGERVLEIGCGTARNLAKLHDRLPSAELLGVDASERMLETARGKLRRRGLGERVTLRQSLAETLGHRETFGLDEPFDAVFFSYALSMMPSWREAVDAALANVKPGGTIHVVDFYDLAGLPGPAAATLRTWLKWFGVHHRPELYAYFHRLHDQGWVELSTEALAGRYAVLVKMRRAAGSTPL